MAVACWSACSAGQSQTKSASQHVIRSGLMCRAQQKRDPSSDPSYRRGSANDYWRKRTDTGKSSKGASVEGDKRRRGRAAHLRSPDDTPLRDGNRDRLMGLLTDRATRTLEHTVSESNPVLNTWLSLYLRENIIPKDGNWSDVSGDNFLRTLLTRPVEEISGSFSEEEPEFAVSSPVGGDPRGVAQKIMDFRHEIAKEWIEELKMVADENKVLLSETLMSSLFAGSGVGSSETAAAETAAAETASAAAETASAAAQAAAAQKASAAAETSRAAAQAAAVETARAAAEAAAAKAASAAAEAAVAETARAAADAAAAKASRAAVAAAAAKVASAAAQAAAAKIAGAEAAAAETAIPEAAAAKTATPETAAAQTASAGPEAASTDGQPKQQQPPQLPTVDDSAADGDD